GDIEMNKIVLSRYENKKVAQIKPADFTLPVSTGADAINGINATNANAAMFNLAGQSVDNSFRGVVIMNGKKVLVK
ncbi:MAG: chitobiase, partial [Prevotellaceae bacterium]|nr:chitobiase [Candidatus Colivivens caballi]